MTPSASLAVAMRSSQFWLDYHGLGELTDNAYEPLINGRAELRAGGHAIVLVFKSPTPHDDIPMLGFSLHIDGTKVALEHRKSGPPPDIRNRAYLLRWSEIETIAQCAAIRDREPHPGATVALLARFLWIGADDDLDRAHAVIAAALRVRDVPDLAIDRILRDSDSRNSHQSPDLPARALPGRWNVGRPPMPDLTALVAAAAAETEAAADRLRTPRAQMLAREVVDGDVSVAPLLAYWLRESGCTNHAMIDALERPEDIASVTWVAEVLANVSRGTMRMPSTPFSFDERDLAVWCWSRGAVDRPFDRYLRSSVDTFRRAVADARIGSWNVARWHVLDTPPGPRELVAKRVHAVARGLGVVVWISWREDGRWRFLDPAGKLGP